MLWIIWIILMLLVPTVAGVFVWWQVRRDSTDAVEYVQLQPVSTQRPSEVNATPAPATNQ